MLRVQARVNGNESGPTARQTRSLIHFIPQTNAEGYTVPASETAAIGAFDGGAAFDDDAIKAAMQKAYDQGGSPTKLVVSPNNKVTVSTFTGRVNDVLTASERKVAYNVTLIETSFGKLEVVVDRFFPTTAARDDFSLLLDPSYYGVAKLRPIASVKLGVVGDYDAWNLNCEWGIKVHNPAAHACIGYDSVP